MLKKVILALGIVSLALPAAARFDFSLTVASGQRLYFLIGSDSASVSVVYPGISGDYYQGYAAPTGQVAIPESVNFMGRSYAVRAIRNRAFSGCDGLTAVIVPQSVRYLGNYALAECASLRTVHLGEGVDSLASNVMRGCTALTTVALPQSLRVVGANAFADCTSLPSVAFGDGIESVGEGLFSGCTSLAEVSLGASMPQVTDNMFSGCTALQLIDLPPTVRRIGEYAFDGCTGLRYIGLQAGLESVGDYAFYHCQDLLSVALPSTVRTVGSYAFYYCDALRSIYFGSGTEGIGDHCLQNCSSLEMVVVNAVLPPAMGTQPLGEVGHEMTVYVPCGRLEVYQQTIIWRLYSHEMVENCGVVGIEGVRSSELGVRSLEGGIILVSGSEGEPLVVSDMAGRTLYTGRTTDPMRVDAGVRGVVAVRVGQRAAKKVLLH